MLLNNGTEAQRAKQFGTFEALKYYLCVTLFCDQIFPIILEQITYKHCTQISSSYVPSFIVYLPLLYFTHTLIYFLACCSTSHSHSDVKLLYEEEKTVITLTWYYYHVWYMIIRSSFTRKNDKWHTNREQHWTQMKVRHRNGYNYH